MRVSDDADDDDDDDCFTVKAKVSSRDNFDKQSGTVTLRIRLRDEQFASITITKGDDLLDSCSKFGAEHGLDYSSVNHLFEQLKERCRLISQFRDVKSTTGQLKDHTDTNANVHANADANRKKSNQDKASLNTVGTSETIKKRSYQSLSSKIIGVDIPKITAISYPRKAGSFTSTATSTAPTSSSSSPEKNIPSVSSKSSSPVKRSEPGTFRHSDQNILLPDDSDTLQCNNIQECSIEGSSGDILKNIPKKIPENVPCEIEDNDEKLQEDAFNIAKKNLQEWNTTERSSSSSPITSIMSHFLTTNREKEKDEKFENLEKKLNLEIPSTLSSPSKTNILLSNNLKTASNIFNKDDQDIISRFSSTQNSINKTQKSSTLRSNSPSLIQQKKSSERMHGHGQKFENKKAYLRLQFEKDRIETIQSTTFRYYYY